MLKQSAERNAIVVRPARAEESEAVAALIHRAFAPYRGILEPAPSALLETTGSIQSAMARGTVLVAVREGAIAGCVSVERRGDSRLALTRNRAFFRRLGFVEGCRRSHPGFTSPTYVELEKILV